MHVWIWWWYPRDCMIRQCRVFLKCLAMSLICQQSGGFNTYIKSPQVHSRELLWTLCLCVYCIRYPASIASGCVLLCVCICVLCGWHATTSVVFLFQFPSSMLSHYIHCFYWATLTLSVINDNLPSPTNTLEFAFTSVNYLFGVFVVAIIIGEVRNYGVTYIIKNISAVVLIYCGMLYLFRNVAV